MKQVSEVIKYKGMLKSIGKRMEISGAYPMSYQGTDVDVTGLLEFRKKNNLKGNISLTINDYIIKATSISLQKVPIINSSFNDDMSEVHLYKSCNISIMTASKKGLVAPVLKETQDKTIFQLSEEMKILIEKANMGRLAPEDYAGGTFGITNIGKLNTYDSVPLPMPPQSAIMTACAARKMPVVLDDGNDTIAVRMIMKLVIGGDHRILQGVPLAEFINSVKDLLENPKILLD